METSHLTPRRALFVLEYLKDLHGKHAAVRAGYAAGSAEQEASRLLNTPEVKAAIDAALAERAQAVKVSAEDVLRDLLAIAQADPNDIVQHRRLCCRHCWGQGFRYQRTAGEMERDRRSHEADMERRQKDAARTDEPFTPTAFDEQGGVGYHGKREPNAECPECFGDGVLDVHVADSRLLTGGARRLYAGVKRTKDGIEVKMRDQDKALELLGRHLGIFQDKLAISGELDLRKASDDELRAELASLVASGVVLPGDPDAAGCPLV